MGDSRVWEEVRGGGGGGLEKVFCNDNNLKMHSEKEEESSGFRNMQRF